MVVSWRVIAGTWCESWTGRERAGSEYHTRTFGYGCPAGTEHPSSLQVLGEYKCSSIPNFSPPDLESTAPSAVGCSCGIIGLSSRSFSANAGAIVVDRVLPEVVAGREQMMKLRCE